MIDKLYHILLYILGFPDKLHITDLLRNQKKRTGVFWWLGVAAFFGGSFALVLHIIGVF